MALDHETTRMWTFSVSLNDADHQISEGECLCVTGSAEQLGAWAPEKVLPMRKTERER